MLSKDQVVRHVEELLDSRLELLVSEIKSLQSSAANETKSSMGDKYETSRANAHLEIEKLARRLSETKQLKLILKQAELPVQDRQIALGSLVKTTNGIFFISCGIGKINVDSKPVFVISAGSPIARLMLHKGVGDYVELNGKSFEIEEISG